MSNTFDKSVADIMNNLKFFNARHDKKKYDNRGEMKNGKFVMLTMKIKKSFER
ncbi:MAG: hypothetical protein GY714_32545 [Desulfobacterales bacterium]|nr:hypothetical protein [Desulfobacterales bacterium]